MWIFLIALTLSSNAGYLATPEKCFSKKLYPCTLQTQGKLKISLGESDLYFSNNSLIEIRSPKNIFIARGAVWGTSKSDFVVNSTYGQFFSTKEGGEYWMHVRPQEHSVKVFSGQIQVQPKGGETYSVSPGNQIALSSVDYKQSACYASRVSVFDFSEYLHNYGKVFPFGKLSVEDHLQKVAGAVLTASSQESQNLKKQVARQLASDLEKDVRLKAQKEAATKLEIYLKRLYKAKSNYEDQ